MLTIVFMLFVLLVVLVCALEVSFRLSTKEARAEALLRLQDMDAKLHEVSGGRA